MIRETDIERLIDRRDFTGETLGAWCRRNDVDEDAVRHIADLFCRTPNATVSVRGFQLGYDARLENEPKGISSPGDAPRYAVQFVVVDRKDGHIVGDAALTQDEAEANAGMYNDLDDAADAAEGSCQ